MLSVLAIPVLDNSFLSALISSLSRSYTIHPRLADVPCLLAINPRCPSIIFPYFASMILPSPRFVVKYSTLLHSKKSSVQKIFAWRRTLRMDNRVGGKRCSFSPTFVFRPLTPPYMRVRIRRFRALTPLHRCASCCLRSSANTYRPYLPSDSVILSVRNLLSEQLI